MASCLFLWAIFNSLMDNLGITTYVDFGETVTVRYGAGPTAYEEEKDGDFTAVGTALNIIAMMFAARIGMAIYEGRLDGGVSKKGNVDFIAWLIGIVLFGIQGAIFFPLFKDTESTILTILLHIVNLAIVIAIFLFCKSWRDRKIQQIDATPKTDVE